MLVTGAAGSVGARLVPALRAAGWVVRALTHRRPVAHADTVIAGDVTQPETLGAAVHDADAVLHLAAVTHARRAADYRAVNVTGTGHLLQAAAGAAGVGRFVHVSTRAIDAAGGAYSASKREAEALVAASGLEHVVVRLPELYGAGGTEGVDDVIDRARRGAAIPLVGAGADVLAPVHVDDAVSALVAALGPGATPSAVYTLAGEPHTMAEVAHASAAAFGTAPRLVRVPTGVVRAACLVARVLPLPIYPDQLDRLRAPKPPPSAAAAADLGFAPRALADGLRELAR